MNILFKWFRMRPQLAVWEEQSFSPGVEEGPRAHDYRDRHERVVAVERPGAPEPDGPFERVAREILGFRIFPPRLVTPVMRREPVEVGDTVGVCYHLFWGVDLFFAARVTGRLDETTEGIRRVGFSYRTLRGHPETGDETFCVEKDLESGRVTAALRSWSRPALLLTRLFAPLTRRFQLHAGRSGVEHLAQVAARAVRGRITPAGALWAR